MQNYFKRPKKATRRASPFRSESPDYFLPMAMVPLAEIRRTFEILADKYPPLLSLEQAAELANLAPTTLKRKISEGHFKESVSRGKPLRFWRDRFVREVLR